MRINRQTQSAPLFFFAVGWLILLIPMVLSAKEPKAEITFLNWAEYVDPDLLAKFEREHHIKVRQVTFDSDDGRTRLLLSTDAKGFDVAIVDGDSLEGYVSRNWLAPVQEKNIPNLVRIERKWREAYPNAATHAVPYFWGTTGIAYRKDLVPQPITSWLQILRPPKELQGKIYMLPQNRELIDIALKATGHSLNSTDENAYREARHILIQQKPFVRKYDFLALNNRSAMLDGSVVAAATYSGDALILQDLDDRIIYVTPEEGGVLWADYLVIMAKSDRIDLAEKFINFLNEPVNAAQLATWVQYASPNRDAEKYLPQDFRHNPTIYPPKEILDRYEIDGKLPANIHRIRSTIFSEVTSGKI